MKPRVVVRIFLSFLIPSLSGVASYCWLPLHKWQEVDSGLLTFLGLIAASIVQVIPLTANFLQPDMQSVEEAKRLSKVLERQQLFWLGLLVSSFLSAMMLLLSRFIVLSRVINVGNILIDIEQVYSAMLGILISFTFFKGFSIYSGVKSLQRFRSDMVIEKIRQNTSMSVSCELQKEPTPKVAPSGYGREIKH